MFTLQIFEKIILLGRKKESIAKVVNDNYVHLCDALCDFGLINNKVAMIHFLAQCMHESGYLRYTKEIWGPTPRQLKYEPGTQLAKDLGNTQKGDGKLFMGRGSIQTTGRKNYEIVHNAIGIDCVKNPSLLEMPQNYWKASCHYFKTRSLKFCTDTSLESIRLVTKSINGGFTHLNERIELTKAVEKLF